MKKRDGHEDAKIRPLTVYLLKTSIKEFKDAIDPESLPRLNTIKLKKGLGFTGVMYWERGLTTPPLWKDFLLEGTDDPLNNLDNLHQSVLVMLKPKKKKRIIAIVFGYARALLKPSCYELDFGLKVVMNVVDPDKLRCLDASNFEEIPVLTKKQASRVSALEMFDVDQESDMLQSLVGTPKEKLADGKEPLLGKVIAGSSALSLRVGIYFKGLGDLSAELLDYYARDDYKTHGFEWVDHLKSVKDKDLIATLDDALLAALKAKDTDHVSMAPPEIIEWEDYEGIRIGSSQKATPFEFAIEDFYSQVKNIYKWDVDRLTSIPINLVQRTEAKAGKRFPLYRCLIFEHLLGAVRYVFTGGGWFNIDQDFTKKVTKFISSLHEANLVMPDYDGSVDKSEGDYTIRTCRANKDFALMDKKLVLPTNARTRVEVCDIFTKARQLVHIKPYKGSSTLSHLFSQGAVSADLFQLDGGFRDQTRKEIESTNKGLANLIPTGSGQVDITSFEVVFAIIKKRTASKTAWQTSLPFFAQLNLMQVAQRLQVKSYKVAVKLISIS
jgi:uncharacterized protein (TIGR04141 family)